MVDPIHTPTPDERGEIVVGSFFEALHALRSAEDEASTPLGKGDMMLAAKIKELRGYVDVFLKAEGPRRPKFAIVERKADPAAPLIVEASFLDAVQFYEGMTLSLSKGGLFVKTDALLPIDTVLDMTVRFETEGVTFRTGAKVIWINPRETQGRPQGMGLKFHRLTAIQRQVLDDFMKAELPPEALGHLTEV
jgi:uncharacterized protein (TIGR02266 family)